jgi:signal transduction histidine kinase
MPKQFIRQLANLVLCPIRRTVQRVSHWQAGLPLRQKITWGYGVAVTIALSGTAVGYMIGDYLQYQVVQRELAVQQRRQLLNDLQITLLQTRTHMSEIITLLNDGKDWREEYAEFSPHYQALQQHWRSLKHLTTADVSRGSTAPLAVPMGELTATYTTAIEAYFQQIDQLIALDPTNTDRESQQQVRQQLQALATSQTLRQVDNFSETLGPLNVTAHQLAAQINEEIETVDRLRLGFSTGGIAISVAIAAYLAWLTSRVITRPLQEMTDVAQLVTEASRFDVQVPITSRDETGQLAQAFNHLITRVQQLLEEQQVVRDRLATDNQSLEALVADRTAALQTQNHRLTQTLETLKTTQTQLVQTAKMSSLGQLVAGIAHEMNNPVTFISGNLAYTQQAINDLLQMLTVYQMAYPEATASVVAQAEAIDLDYLLEDMPNVLKSMQQGSLRIAGIVQSLRTFSHLDEAELKSIDVHVGLDHAVMLLQNRLQTLQPAIAIQREYATLPRVECHASQLNQVFLDLLNNAIDAVLAKALDYNTAAGFVPCIGLRSELLDQTVRLVIEDNGVGIAADHLTQIFDPFFTTKPIGQGMGLGLSLAYQVIEVTHGGQITCESVPQVGSRFTIVLPIAPVPAIATVAHRQSSTSAQDFTAGVA